MHQFFHKPHTVVDSQFRWTTLHPKLHTAHSTNRANYWHTASILSLDNKQTSQLTGPMDNTSPEETHTQYIQNTGRTTDTQSVYCHFQSMVNTHNLCRQLLGNMINPFNSNWSTVPTDDTSPQNICTQHIQSTGRTITHSYLSFKLSTLIQFRMGR